MEAIGSIVVGLVIMALLVMSHIPKGWQTPAGFASIAFVAIPAFIVFSIIAVQPWFLVPAVFALGALCAHKAR